MTDAKDDPVVEIYLGEEQLEIRRLLRSALRDLQLDTLQDYESCAPLREAVREGQPDLIIVDSDLAGGNACDLIRAIRNSRLGTNPFVPVIVTTWRNTRPRIRALIDSGADGLLIKPISFSAIQSHVNFIVNERKPFVVTSSYIGPDRRKDPKHSSAAPLIEVPNTLKAKLRGDAPNLGELRRQIASISAQIDTERLRRNAFELAFLVERALADHASGVSAAKLRTDLERLLHVTGDTLERLRGSAFEASADLCRTLRRVVTAILESAAKPSRVDLQFLKPLTDAILAGFHPDRSEAEISREIIRTIDVYEAREGRRN